MAEIFRLSDSWLWVKFSDNSRITEMQLTQDWPYSNNEPVPRPKAEEVAYAPSVERHGTHHPYGRAIGDFTIYLERYVNVDEVNRLTGKIKRTWRQNLYLRPEWLEVKPRYLELWSKLQAELEALDPDYYHAGRRGQLCRADASLQYIGRIYGRRLPLDLIQLGVEVRDLLNRIARQATRPLIQEERRAQAGLT